VNGSSWEGVGRGVSEHSGSGDAAGDQEPVDACELAQRGVACMNCSYMGRVKTHIKVDGESRLRQYAPHS
jgi:hypothetical protein